MDADKPGRVMYEVTYTDGKVEKSRQTLTAEVAFERHFGESVANLAVQRRAEWLYFLAWKSTPHSGDDFDAWLESVDTVDIEVVGAAPLDRSPSPGE